MRIYKVEYEYKADWSDLRPETMEWHTCQDFVLPGEGEKVEDLIQAYCGSFGRIRNVKVISEHYLIEYIMTHNKATVNRAIYELKKYRDK